MRRTGILLSAILLVAGPATAALATQVERVVSDKGVEAWLVEDRGNPVISMSFAFRGGAIADPPGRAGLANMVSALLDEGAGDLDSLAFQRRAEDLAVHIGFNAGRDTFSGSLKTLTENRGEAFDLLRLALTEPRFDEGPVERIRSQIVSSLARQLEDPNTVATRLWYRQAFPDHAYGTPSDGDPETVEAITIADLRGFAKGRFARGNLVIGVSGDIGAGELKPLLDLAFGALPQQAAPLDVAEVTPALPGGMTIERWEIPQSVVFFGETGIDRRDPDWYAALVLNYVLGGGGFSSRLMEEVREKRGLAYGIYTHLAPMDYADLLLGSVATDNARVHETLELLRQEWRRMREQGPTAEELENAKTYLTGSFPLQFTSTGSIAGILVGMQLEELGMDYLDRRNDHIEAVTLDDARRVAGRLLDPERLTAVVVGDPDGFARTN